MDTASGVRRRVLAVLLAAAVTALLVSCASVPSSRSTPIGTATPAPVSALTWGSGSQTGSLRVDAPGPVTVTYKRITLRPGASTGKHCHDGELVAVVKKGTLTHYAPIYPSGVHRYHAGQSLVEGPGYVHEGRNEGTTDVVLLVTYIIPKGKPLAETDLSHCDAQR